MRGRSLFDVWVLRGTSDADGYISPTQFFVTIFIWDNGEARIKKLIPIFPDFKFLEWNDRKNVEEFTSGFPPYSDFNFVSLWSWNTRDKMMLSQLNGNLVVLFYDYVSEKPFLSFIGKSKLSETASELLEYSKEKYKIDYLKLISEAVASNLSDSEFKILPDEDSHDYILSVSYLINIHNHSSNKITHAGKGCKRFLKLYPQYSAKIVFGKEIRETEYIELFKQWSKSKHYNHWELNEFKAFERLLQNKETDNQILSIYDGDNMIGFATIEILLNDYSVCHFTKADANYKGIYDALFWEVCKVLNELKIKYWNIEQDLGIPQLRQSKQKYKPVFYLKKYFITKENGQSI